jgi:serine/threonine-protein kinase
VAYLQRYDRKGNISRAINTLEPAVRQDSANTTLHAVLAEAYVRKSSETGDTIWLQKAAESGRNAVVANDNLAVAHVALGMALAENGQNQQAVAELERARDLDPLSGPAHLALAKVRFAQGQLKEAEQLHEKAVQLSPGEWAPITWLGIFYYRTARYAEAVNAWRNALQLSPDNVIIMRNLGPGYYVTGQYAEAAATFQRALELDPTAVSTWANLGTARYFEGRYAEAAGAMEKAVQLVPNNYLYWGNLGDGYRWAPGLRSKAAAAYSNAIRLAREKLALELNDTAVRSSLAVYLAKAGDTAGALSEVAQIERTRANSPGTIYKTALVYELAQDRGKALEALARAIQAGYSMSEVVNEPELAALRSDPNYHRIANPSTTVQN